MARKLFVVTMLGLAAGSGIAAELTDFVPAEDGASACWQRIYSAEHLAAHPDQQVTEMTLSMSYATFESDPGLHMFGIEVAMKDGLRGEVSGTCYKNDIGAVSCGVDCDGGGFGLQMRDKGSVLVDLETYGRLLLESECGSDGEGTWFELTPGLDDKVFLLNTADAKACKALLPDW